MQTRANSQEVNAYFYIEFNNNSLVRCGLVKNKKRLLMQAGNYNKAHMKGYHEPMTNFEDGYDFGEDNFQTWIDNLDDGRYHTLKTMFNFNNEKN